MSTSVSSVTSHFPSAENGFSTTTSGSVSSGASSVGLNSVAGYTNGEIVALIIDPDDSTKKQTFTGTVDTGGSQVTGVVWTAGTNQGHSAGATVVDYATATHISMMTKGILVHANQDGTLKDDSVDSAQIADGAIDLVHMSANSVDSDQYVDGSIDTAHYADGSVTSEKLDATIAFSASRTTNQSITGGGVTKIQLATENYDLGADFDNATNYRFVAPLAGIYNFSGQAVYSAAPERIFVSLYKNGAEALRGNDVETSVASGARSSTVAGDLQLAVNDYVELYAFSDDNADVNPATLTGHFVGA